MPEPKRLFWTDSPRGPKGTLDPGLGMPDIWLRSGPQVPLKLSSVAFVVVLLTDQGMFIGSISASLLGIFGLASVFANSRLTFCEVFGE